MGRTLERERWQGTGSNKRRLAGQHAVNDYPQGIEVGAAIYRFTQDLLWRHVFGCTNDHPAAGETAALTRMH